MAIEPFVLVQVNAGSASYDLSTDLSSLRIRETVGSSAELRCELSDSFKVFGSALREGMPIEVDLGTKKDHSFVFRGIVSKMSARMSEDGTPTVTVQANDNLIELGLKKTSLTITSLTLKAIVSDLASKVFPSISFNFADDPHVGYGGIRQQDTTSLDLLNTLAGDFGCAVFAHADKGGTTLLFRTQAGIMEGDPNVVLRYGSCAAEDALIDFEAETDVSRIEFGVTISAMDPRTGKQITTSSKSTAEEPERNTGAWQACLARFGEQYPDKAKKLSALFDAAPSVARTYVDTIGSRRSKQLSFALDESALQFAADSAGSTCREGLVGRGSTKGNHHMFASGLLELNNVGTRLSGRWYLSEVEHILDEKGYRTEFKCQK